jgi:hypothetical protein
MTLRADLDAVAEVFLWLIVGIIWVKVWWFTEPKR